MDSSSSSSSSFRVKLSYKGKHVIVRDVTDETTVAMLTMRAEDEFELDKEHTSMKLLFKGKVLSGQIAFPNGVKSSSSSIAKVMVMATPIEQVVEVRNRKSDPTVRGFDNEKKQCLANTRLNSCWKSQQDRQYKFCRFEECSWQSFGHRTGDQTPHSFQARSLLENLATDPGVVAIMVERELVVNCLGEMDPIDDRIMEKTQQHGGCLLGYNTNHGLRIDIKLRSDDLQSFRPYPQLVSTLIHELSHNWVSDHNALFWTNYGTMRAEYFYTHLYNYTTLVNGKTTAQLAEIPQSLKSTRKDIYSFIIHELRAEMMQHGLVPELIAPAIQSRCTELEQQQMRVQKHKSSTGQTLSATPDNTYQQRSRRELLLEAATKRQHQAAKDDSEQHEQGNQNDKTMYK